MVEQSIQLLLKAVILELSGEFPNTHSIRKLIGLLYHITGEEKLKYDRKALIFLETAYLNSCYLNFSYEKEDAKEALKIGKEVGQLVKNVRDDDKKEEND